MEILPFSSFMISFKGSQSEHYYNTSSVSTIKRLGLSRAFFIESFVFCTLHIDKIVNCRGLTNTKSF